MTNIHFDLAEAEARLRETYASEALRPNAHPHHHVLMRNREARIQLVLMYFRERNAGTDSETYINAIANMISEVLANVFGDDAPEACAAFCETLEDHVRQTADGRSFNSGSTDIPVEKGGHA